MWRTSHAPSFPSAPAPAPLPVPAIEGQPPAPSGGDPRTCSYEEVKIGKGQFVKGKISGSGPLFIDGRVEGDIDIPNERVTIGENGVFISHARKGGQFGITAREIVILGQVIGSVSASHRVEIFRSGSLTGDLHAPRLRIADGGFCKGGVNL